MGVWLSALWLRKGPVNAPSARSQLSAITRIGPLPGRQGLAAAAEGGEGPRDVLHPQQHDPARQHGVGLVQAEGADWAKQPGRRAKPPRVHLRKKRIRQFEYAEGALQDGRQARAKRRAYALEKSLWWLGFKNWFVFRVFGFESIN